MYVIRVRFDSLFFNLKLNREKRESSSFLICLKRLDFGSIFVFFGSRVENG